MLDRDRAIELNKKQAEQLVKKLTQLINSKYHNNMIVSVKLTKLREADNPLFPNNIEEGYTIIRSVYAHEFHEPEVGESFYLYEYNSGGMFSTSTVQEIIDSNTFRTHNSIYRWEII